MECKVLLPSAFCYYALISSRVIFIIIDIDHETFSF
jgi:hypothetical protein